MVQPPTPLESSASASEQTITLELKLAKSSLSYTLAGISLLTPVSTAKQALSTQERTRAPPATDQKWLLKGKVLNDDKLLSEYFSLETGDTSAPVTIMLKPGAPQFPANTQLPEPVPQSETDNKGSFAFPAKSASNNASPSLSPSMPPGGRSHMRVPSLTLNTSNIELDPSQQQPATSHRRSPSLSSQFQNQVTDPAFWQDTHQFLVAKFGGSAQAEDEQGDAAAADRLWETWFGASKNWLTPNEVAKIRDHVGLTGMGGSLSQILVDDSRADFLYSVMFPLPTLTQIFSYTAPCLGILHCILSSRARNSTCLSCNTCLDSCDSPLIRFEPSTRRRLGTGSYFWANVPLAC